MDVENFVFQKTAQGARRDVSNRVVTSFPCRQADIRQRMQQGGNFCQRHEMILNVLPRGQVPFAARELVGDQG